MVSSGMLRRVALVRTDVSEYPSATRRNIPEATVLLGYSSVKSECEPTLQRNVSPSFSRSKQSEARNQCAAGIPEDGTIHSYHCEDLNSHLVFFSLMFSPL
jgi:hypothetical protein